MPTPVSFTMFVTADDAAEATEQAEKVLDRFPPMDNAETGTPEKVIGGYFVNCTCWWNGS